MEIFYTLTLIIMLVLLIAALPRWRYSRHWGYFPSGIIAALLILFLLLVVFDVVSLWQSPPEAPAQPR